MTGDLDRSHTISQEIKDAEGSFWHGIMHRREGDFWNAKYWMRSLRHHAVARQLAELSSAYIDPEHFIDACEKAIRSGKNQEELRLIQWQEWQLLFVHCLQH